MWWRVLERINLYYVVCYLNIGYYFCEINKGYSKGILVELVLCVYVVGILFVNMYERWKFIKNFKEVDLLNFKYS